MSSYDNNMSGVLFKNKNKKTESSPDYTGSAQVDGIDYRISSWIKKSSKGVTFMSLAFTVKDQETKPVQTTIADEDAPF